MADDLNEVVEEVVQDATVITVPIDDTLSVSGEAADAKAVGDALADKADRSELSTAVNVNGQSADAQGTILITGEDIPVSEDDATTLEAAVLAIQAWDAADINVDDTAVAPVTVQDAIVALQAQTAEDIYMDSTHSATIAAAMTDFTDAEIQQMLIDAGYEEDE